jgi:hypothetical protein
MFTAFSKISQAFPTASGVSPPRLGGTGIAILGTATKIPAVTSDREMVENE